MSQSERTGSEHARHDAARAALLCALVLGVAADRLLEHGIIGAGFVAWTALFGAAAVLVAWRARFAWLRETVFSACIALAASVIPATRASDELMPIVFLVLIASASVPMLRARGFRFGSTPLATQLIGMLMVPAHAVAGVLLLAGREVARPTLQHGHWRGLTVATRGALLAVPPLVVFGALFVSADPLFEHYVDSALQFVTHDFIAHLFLAFVFAWITAGLLRGLLPQHARFVTLPAVPSVPANEIAVALGAVAALFTAFLAVQARWLFNGEGALAAIEGLTAADYARRGFFELMAASALTLPLLLAASTVTRQASGRARRMIRVLSVVMVLFVFLLIASAFERMSLYTTRFGLTETRVFATVFMLWLGVVFLWYSLTTLRDRAQRFAAGPLAAGIAAAFALAIVNPDALVARVNLQRAQHGAEVDARYLAQLSEDAAPALFSGLGAIPAEGRCAVAKRLASYANAEEHGWRTANVARERARALSRENATVLQRMQAESCVPNERTAG